MSLTTKERRVAELARELAEARIELDRAKRIRTAEPPKGATVRITVRFPSSSVQYTYLALRTHGNDAEDKNWYVTGEKGRISWDHLIARVERGDYQVQELYFR